MSVWVVDAWDHSSTDDKSESNCIVRFIGEYVGVDDNFIYLRHIKADLNTMDSAEEIHRVFKPAIIRKRKFYIEWNDKELVHGR